MNFFAHRRWLAVPIEAASSAAFALALSGLVAGPAAWGQSPSLDAAANNPGGTGYTSNPYIPGQQLIPGSRIAPTQTSRPAGWPGGADADDSPPPPKSRQRYAPAFGKNASAGTPPGAVAGQASTGQPAAGAQPGASPAGAVAQPAAAAQTGAAAPSGPAAMGPAQMALAAHLGLPTQPGVDPQSNVGSVANVTLNYALGGALPPGAQVGPPGIGGFGPGGNQAGLGGTAATMPATGFVPPGSAVNPLPPINSQSAVGVSPGGALPGGALPSAAMAGAAAAALGTESPGPPESGGGPELVASAMTTPAYPSSDQKRPLVPFPIPATFTGAEIIARVGPEVILASDVLPDANRTLQKAREQATSRGQRPPTEEEAEFVRKMYMAKFLERIIETKLVIVEGRRLIPKDAWGKVEKQFDAQFDKEYLPRMLEAEECTSRTELDLKLRKNGSSLLGMKHQSMESSFAAYFLEEKAKDDREITHEEIHAYYRDHLSEYETPAKARWEHLMAKFDKFSSKDEAWQAIASWGNDVVKGTPLADVAQAHSQDASATDGGVHSWTTKGSLASEVIDEALFTLPVGQLSRILEDPRGFHIIRVLERHDLEVTPFTEKQAEIVKRIREERINDKRNEYKAKLRERIPVWNIFEEADKAREQAETLQAMKKGTGETATR